MGRPNLLRDRIPLNCSARARAVRLMLRKVSPSTIEQIVSNNLCVQGITIGSGSRDHHSANETNMSDQRIRNYVELV